MQKKKLGEKNIQYCPVESLTRVPRPVPLKAASGELIAMLPMTDALAPKANVVPAMKTKGNEESKGTVYPEAA